jgi:hypothetical protein
MAPPPDANEHWDRLSGLYHAALALEPSQRKPFLADACGSDAAPHRELESLLEQPGVDAFLESPFGAGQTASPTVTAVDAIIGRDVGAYRVQSVLGSGGMGVVYKALDAKFNRTVAIKFLSGTLTDTEGRRRFVREAQTASSLSVHARLQRGLTLQIGSSTGRAEADNCDIVAKVPEVLNNALTNPSSFVATRYQLADSCHKVETWQTQVRGFVAYTIPKIAVLVSTIMRSQPNVIFGGGRIPAAAPEGNSAGLSALYATQQGQINLLQPGQVYGERINQVDLRVGKNMNVGHTHANIAVDVLNLANANTPTSYQQNYGDGRQYLQPLTILNPRFARFNVTVEF